jgi:hypothetical protein
MFDAADHVDAVGVNGGDGPADVAGVQSAGENDGQTKAVSDPAGNAPVDGPTGPRQPDAADRIQHECIRARVPDHPSRRVDQRMAALYCRT